VSIYFLLFNMVLQFAIPVGIQLWDRKRMSPSEREWVWNFASWGSAVYNFGPVSLLAWGYVTRSPRYWQGLWIGWCQSAAALILQGAINDLVGRAAGLAPKELREMREGFGLVIVLLLGLAVLVGVCRTVYEVVRRLAGRGAVDR
jgi:hypothetical protein